MRKTMLGSRNVSVPSAMENASVSASISGQPGWKIARQDVLVVSMREVLPILGDQVTLRELRERLHRAADAGVRHVIFDLTGVVHVDSAVLGLFVGVLRRLRDDNGTVSIVGPSPVARRALELTCLFHLFPVTTTVPEAMSGLPRQF